MTVFDPPEPAGVPFDVAAEARHAAAEVLFAQNPRAFSVGVGRGTRPSGSPDNWAFHVTSDRGVIVPESAEVPIPRLLFGIPVRVREVSRIADDLQRGSAAVAPTALPPGMQPPGAACEQQRVRPLVCGLQVENALHGTGRGSTGCYVRTASGGVALMSNNHVIAGSNRGTAGEAIHQPAAHDNVATLMDYPPLLTTPAFNTADIALARVDSGLAYSNGFHPSRALGPLSRFLTGLDIVRLVATKGNVFKVGANGYAEGRIDQLLVQTKEINYGHPGMCRFLDVIVSVHRTDPTVGLTAPGDSGAPIFDDSGGIAGIHFAGGLDEESGDQVSWACTPSGIEAALRQVFGTGFTLQLPSGGIA